MPAPLSYTGAPDIIQDRHVMLIGIFYKVGIKMREENSLKFQLKGTPVWQRELLSYKTCKGGAHQNFLPPSIGFHSPQEKYRLIPNNTIVLISQRYRYRMAKYASTRGTIINKLIL